MLGKVRLPYLLMILFVLALVAQNVAAQPIDWGTVQVKGVNAPASVGAGQPVTVSITVGYLLMHPMESESLVIGLMAHTETGNLDWSTPYPILAVSNNCRAPSAESMCFALTNPPLIQNVPTTGVITVSFTLTAPSTLVPETWRPSALAYIVVLNSGGSGYTTEAWAYHPVVITVAPSMMFKIDGYGKDWSNFTAIMSKGATQSATPGRDLQAVYAVADGTYLYIMIKLYGQPDPGNNYIIPLDLTGTGRWDYSFGFNANSVWMYDLRGIPNGQWPESRLSTPDAIYAVRAVAEIAIPLEIIGNPTRIDIADVWIYYPSLGETVDQFGKGASVPFITSPTSTATSSVSEYAATTATETSSTNSTSAIGLNSPIRAQTTPVWVLGLFAVLVVAAIATVVQLRRTKTKTKLERP